MAHSLDSIDLKILDLLQKDARMKMVDISEKVNLSVPAVTRRIQKMEDNGIIRSYRTLIDAEKVGVEVHGFLIGGVQKVSLQRFYDYIQTVTGITRCETIISGGKEILLEFYLRSLDELMELYKSDVRKYIDSMTVYLVKGAPRQDKIIPLEKILSDEQPCKQAENPKNQE